MKRLKEIIKICIHELDDPYYQGVAGQLAFFLFLSILPIMTLLSQLLGLFSLSLDGIKAWANINVSAAGVKLLENLISTDINSAGGNIVLLITTIWSASKAQYALSGVADYIYSDGGGYKYGYIRRRARSYVLILVLLVMVVITLAVLVYAPLLLRLIFGESRASAFFSSIWSSLRWLIVFILYLSTISITYYITPSVRIPFKAIIPGSIFSAVGFILVTMVYSEFTEYSTSTNIMYGSMTGIVVLLVWFWFISWVICLGNILNKAWKLRA